MNIASVINISMLGLSHGSKRRRKAVGKPSSEADGPTKLMEASKPMG